MQDPLVKARKEELHYLRGFYKSSLFNQFYNEIGIGGFKYMFNRTGIRRKIWTVVWLTALFSSSYFFYQAIIDYARYRVYIMYTKTEASQIEFPTITFCNYDSTLSSKLDALNVTQEEFKNFYQEINKFDQNRNRTLIEQIKRKLRASNIRTMLDLVNRTQLTMHDMMDDKAMMVRAFSTCYFYGRNCNADEFQVKSNWMPPGAYCSEFNSYKPGRSSFVVNKTGIVNHFSVALDLHIEDMLVASHLLKGLFIHIHRYGTPGYLLEFGELFTIKPGYVNIFSIMLEEIDLLPSPYKAKCGKTNLKILKRYPYSQAACKVDCILQHVYQKCGCVGFEFKDFVDVQICNIEEHGCYVKEREVENLVCDCPVPCRFHKYVIKQSQLKLGSQHLYNKFAKDFNVTAKEIKNIVRDHVVVAWFYVHNLHILKGSDTPKMTLSNLLGTVGGNIGLFVSFSVITIMEVLLFCWRYNKFKRQKIVRKMSYQTL